MEKLNFQRGGGLGFHGEGMGISKVSTLTICQS